MSDARISPLSDLEIEFINEQKGEGSLSIYVGEDTSDSYIGYDINPEDIGALYFDGIGVPRWESLQADNVEQQTAMYWEQFNERMAAYPLIARVRDTDKRVEYAPDEITQLRDECERIMAGTSDPKAIRALNKLSLAGSRATEKQGGLSLTPSQSH